MSMITPLLFVATFDSCTLISITLSCVYVIAYTFVDGCTSASMMFSSFTSIYVVYVSTNYCSTTSSSSNSSMNTKPIDVTPSHVYSLTHQRLLLLCKNLTSNVPILSISWIIVCKHFIFWLYAFLLHTLKMMNAMATLQPMVKWV